MSKEPTKQSAYADYLYNKVDEYVRDRAGSFTVKEIAEFANLTVTGNLRRRLNHCVATGRLYCFYARGNKRGSHIVYAQPGASGEIGDIPF